MVAAMEEVVAWRRPNRLIALSEAAAIVTGGMVLAKVSGLLAAGLIDRSDADERLAAGELMSGVGRKRTYATSRVSAWMAASPTIRIGTAGWSIAREAAEAFPAEGTGLERYSAVFSCAEINSSFHRPHRASTWEKWRESVPAGFRFSAKLPKTITHEARLVGTEALVDTFLGEAGLLGDKLAVLLVQLPPSLALDPAAAVAFFRTLRQRSPAKVTVEPRHASWFTDEAAALLVGAGVSRAGADPARVPGAETPVVVDGLAYWRLHGSPVVYRSSYADRLDTIAAALGETQAAERWCIFDNTASSAATGDALALSRKLAALSPRSRS